MSNLNNDYSALERVMAVGKIEMSYKSMTKSLNIVMFLTVMCSWIGSTIINFDSIVFYLFSCAAPFLIAEILNDGEYNKIRPGKIFTFLFFGYTLTFLAGSVMTMRMGSVVLGLTYVIAFPLIAKVMSTAKKQRVLIDSLANALIFNFIIILILSLIIVNPKDQAQYSGIMINPNTLGLICAAVLLALAYKIHYKTCPCYYICTGAAGATLFFTQSRTSVICAVLIFVIMLIHALRRKDFAVFSPLKVGICIFSALLLFGCVFYLSPLSAKANAFVYENCVREEVKEDARDVELGDRNFDRLSDSMSGDGDFTTGRKAIWKAYIEGIRISPNGDDVVPVVNGEKLELSAHNTYIHLSYCFGLLCGLFYLLFNVWIGILSLIKHIKKRDFISLLNLIAVVSYGMVTLVETSYNFATYIICYIYWLFTFAITIPDLGEEKHNG